MKTILHIIDTTGPGGAETVFIDLVTRLSTTKYRSVIVLRGKGWVYEELMSRGIEPVLLNAKGSFNWRYLLSLRKIIKQERVNLIQSHLLGSNIYSSLAGIITGVPVVATFHGAVDIGLSERFKRLKFYVINIGAKRIISVSKNLSRDIVERTSVKKEKLQIIYNGIVVDEFNESHSDLIRKQFKWDDSVIIVGSLGNVRSAKGYDILLRAAAILKDKSLPFRFVIAGQGGNSLHDELLSLRSELNLEDYVHFLGFNNAPSVFLSCLDIFLLSSTSEGFSIATIQAMSSGIPVIATRSGGPEEIIHHGENGWLIDAGNPIFIAEALESLANDLPLQKVIKNNATEHVKSKFSMDMTISQYEAVYDELI